jgi:hypothetical protein
MTRQCFPDQTEASHVQLIVVSTCAGGHCIGCETRVAKGLDDRFAGAVQIIMLVGREGGKVVRRPLIKPRGELPMRFVKKGQSKKLWSLILLSPSGKSYRQLPSKTGCCLSTKALYARRKSSVCMQIA